MRVVNRRAPRPASRLSYSRVICGACRTSPVTSSSSTASAPPSARPARCTPRPAPTTWSSAASGSWCAGTPSCRPERIDEVAIAATTQTGDQGLTLGRTAALLAGLPRSVPGFAIDRMCAGAMTAVTTVASGIAFGAYDVAIAGGVEHMTHHPMGFDADVNPRFVAETPRRPLRAGDGRDRREPPRPLPRASPASVPTRTPRSASSGSGGRTPTASSRSRWSASRCAAPSSGWGLAVGRRTTAARHDQGGAGRRCGPRSARTAGSPRATPPASTTAPPPAWSPPRTWPPSSACPPRCGWSPTPSPASTPR